MSAVERHPAIAVAHGRRRSSSRHRFGRGLRLSPQQRGLLRRAAPVLSIAPALLGTLLVHAITPVSSAAPAGGAVFQSASGWASLEPGALAGPQALGTAGQVQLGLLQRLFLGGVAQPVATAAHEGLLVVALLSVALLWLLLRRTGASLLAAGAAAATFGIAPEAVALHATAAPVNLAVLWLLASAIAATRRHGVVGPAMAGAAAAIAVVTSPLAVVVVPLIAVLEAARPRRAVRAVEDPQEQPRRRLVIAGAAFAAVVVLAGVVAAVLAILPAGAAARQLAALGAAGSAAFPVPAIGVASVGAWLTTDPLSLVVAAIGLGAAVWRPDGRPVAVAGAVLILASIWPTGHDATSAAALLLVVAAVATARALDAAVVALGAPTFRVSVIGAGWLMGVAALVVVSIAIWIAGIGGGSATVAAPDRQAALWVRAHVATDRTVLTELAGWPDLRAAAGSRAAWYSASTSAASTSTSWATSTSWSSADYVIADRQLLASATGSARSALTASRTVATFGSGAAQLQVRAVSRATAPSSTSQSSTGGTTPSTNEQASAQVLAARRTAGAELTANPALTAASSSRALLSGGEVDARISIALGQLLTGHHLTVAGFPAVSGETGGRRQVLVSSIDGTAITGSGTAASIVQRYFGALGGEYAVQRIVTDRNGVLITLPPDPTFLPAS